MVNPPVAIELARAELAQFTPCVAQAEGVVVGGEIEGTVILSHGWAGISAPEGWSSVDTVLLGEFLTGRDREAEAAG